MFDMLLNKTAIPLTLVGYKMVITNSSLRASSATSRFISSAVCWKAKKALTCCPSLPVLPSRPSLPSRPFSSGKMILRMLAMGKLGKSCNACDMVI